MRRLTGVVLSVFLGSLALNWPQLPLGVRLPELLFLPLAIAAVVSWRGARPTLTRLDVLAAAYVAGALPSFLGTDDVRTSGIELVRHVYLVALYTVVAWLVASRQARRAATGLALGAAVLSVVGLTFAAIHLAVPVTLPEIGEVMKLPYVGEALRLRALTLSPSMLGSFLTAAVPFALVNAVRLENSRQRGAWWLACIAIAAAMALTMSHTIGGFAIATVAALWPILRPRPVLRAAALAGALVVVVAFNVTLMASVRSLSFGNDHVADESTYPYAIDQREAAIGDLRVQYQVMSYLRTKQLAFEAFVAHPWTGIGLDRFHRLTEAAYQRGRLTAGYRNIDPHSTLPGRLAETGIAGGVTLIALWAAFAVAGVRLMRGTGDRAWLARAATAASIGLLVNSINVDVMNFRFVWAELGLLRGLAHGTDA